MISNDNAGKNQLEESVFAGNKVPLGKIADRLEAAHAALRARSGRTDEDPAKTYEEQVHHASNLNFIARFQETLLAKMPRGMITVDMDGNITTYNKAAEALLNVPAEEVLFQPFWKHFEDRRLGFSLRQALKEKHSPGTVTAQEAGPGGEHRLIESEVSFFHYSETAAGNDGHQENQMSAGGIIILLQDVSEKKQGESISQQRQQMNEIGELAAALAHEIRNPLGGIKGFASLLERDLSDRPDLKRMATYIIEGTNTLNNLVTKVLNYASPFKMLFESVDLVPLVKQLRNEILNSPTYGKNIRIEIQTDHDSIITTIDPHSIRKSLQNLIVNAIEAMSGSGGTVTISLIKNNSSVQVRIKDTGRGISKDNLQKIFSPFFTTKPDANGFGLSETYKIIQLHGGKIHVESKEGEGTSVTIKIPQKGLMDTEQ